LERAGGQWRGRQRRKRRRRQGWPRSRPPRGGGGAALAAPAEPGREGAGAGGKVSRAPPKPGRYSCYRKSRGWPLRPQRRLRESTYVHMQSPMHLPCAS
jgi:hypothetical protein